MNKTQAFNEEEARKADRFALIQKLGLEYSAVFVPFSQSRNANEKNKSLNWRVTIKRGNASLTTDYMQGIAHVPGYKQAWFNGRLSVDAAQEREYTILEATERGKAGGRWMTNIGTLAGSKPLPAPSLEEVLYSLIQDADALDSPTFEEWADSYGYDKDSRSAEEIYRACLEIGLKLRAMLGDENLSKLRELYQDF